MRFNKRIATSGPAGGTPEGIEKLADLGANVCRLNFSHGSHESHGKVIKMIKDINKKGKHSLGILLDVRGSGIRTGDVKEKINVKEGDLIIFTPKITGKEKHITLELNYDKFAHDVKNADTIIIDNGAMELDVVKIEGKNVIAKAREAGTIGSRRHVNIPGAYVSLPSFTDKDWEDIEFGIQQGVDFFATSFIRTAEDVKEVRDFIKKRKADTQIIAKIETPQSVENIEAIVDASDGIMVARGDLGCEIPFEDVPRVQNEIVRLCREKGKFVIVATHMLESMITNRAPTRAEVTDVAYASMIQADCTMLSGETAGGMYPYKSLAAMAQILKANETQVDPMESMLMSAECGETTDMDERPRREESLAASVLAYSLQAQAIIVITKSGFTAKAVSNCRPLIPIYAFTDTESVQRKLAPVWGVSAHTTELRDNPETTVKNAIAMVRKLGGVKKGDRFVVISDIATGDDRATTIQIRVAA
ncbi:MAG TPA: pyruvate kinase [Candidatus Peribacteria bacterium]|nr:pyruvate kinase [Candidatus Peribacteria bacterium]